MSCLVARHSVLSGGNHGDSTNFTNNIFGSSRFCEPTRAKAVGYARLVGFVFWRRADLVSAAAVEPAQLDSQLFKGADWRDK